MLLLDLQLSWKDTPTQVFSCKYCEDFKNSYFEEDLKTAASEAFAWSLCDELFEKNLRAYKQVIFTLFMIC